MSLNHILGFSVSAMTNEEAASIIQILCILKRPTITHFVSLDATFREKKRSTGSNASVTLRKI